jgi:tubulin polyglutamylase TTLL6/13
MHKRFPDEYDFFP